MYTIYLQQYSFQSTDNIQSILDSFLIEAKLLGYNINIRELTTLFSFIYHIQMNKELTNISIRLHVNEKEKRLILISFSKYDDNLNQINKAEYRNFTNFFKILINEL